jgi:nucleoside-diphosphate-sugar epimerase
MKIFLTGGTGYIGSAVLDAFAKAGHHVDALVRNNERAEQVQARGAHPVIGDLADPSTYAEAAAAAEGIVLTAAEQSPRRAEVDSVTLDAVLSTPATRGRFVIYTSGVWVLGPTASPADENAPLNPIELAAFRPAIEQRVLDSANVGWRAVVVRPGIVYGGGRGIVGDLLRDASNSLVRVVGPGDNHWPLVYDRDLADLYLKIAVTPSASGIFHANDEGDETVNEIVAALSEHAKTEPSVRHVPLKEARRKMGAYADALALDQIVRSPRARALGWQPSLKSVSGNAARLFEEYRRSLK